MPANARRVLEDVAEGLADITFQSLETGMVNQDMLIYSSSGILMGFRCVMAPSHPLASREPLDLEDLLSCPVTIVGDYGNGTSTRLSSYIGITTTEVIPYERYRIMSCCLQGGSLHLRRVSRFFAHRPRSERNALGNAYRDSDCP